MGNPFWTEKGEGDVIQSSTLNLTKVTTYLALVIGSMTAGFGANAEEKPASAATDAPKELRDWFNFNEDQRLVIIVALIGAVAIVHAADLLARSLATSRAVSSSVHLFPAMRQARKTTPDEADVSGWVAAIRTGDGAMLFYDPDSASAPGEWVSADRIEFTS